MPGYVAEGETRRIREAIDLVALIGDYTVVQRAGVNFRACCPFHQERSPSFYIYTDDMHYHCYGCGVHGDAIRFAMEKESLPFVEAMEFLARRAGLELTYQEGKGEGLPRGDRQRYLDLMERATALYERWLWQRPEGEEARAYLAERGLSEAVCREFRLGWAPGGATLVRGAVKTGAEERDLLALDLARASERDGQLYDRFRTRLTFPIRDRFGNPVAFSARLLPRLERELKEAGKSQGKYINSTDTPIYHKGSVVYNLDRARLASKDRGRLLVMEGPTDVMAAAQAGLKECVAVLGTALTGEHARQLGRLTGEHASLLLCFDGDRAGQQNSLKAVRTCLAAGVAVRVVMMPQGEDPAELLAHGEEGMRLLEAALAGHKPDLAHLLANEAPRPHALTPVERQRVIDEILTTLAQVPDAAIRQGLLEQVGDYFDVGATDLAGRMRQVGNTVRPAAGPVAEPAVTALPDLETVQERLLALLVTRPELRPRAFDDLGVEPAAFPGPWAALVARLHAEPAMQVGDLLAPGGDGSQPHPGVVAALARWQAETTTGKAWKTEELATTLAELASRVVERSHRLRLSELEHRMRDAADRGDYALAARLAAEFDQCRLAVPPTR